MPFIPFKEHSTYPFSLYIFRMITFIPFSKENLSPFKETQCFVTIPKQSSNNISIFNFYTSGRITTFLWFLWFFGIWAIFSWLWSRFRFLNLWLGILKKRLHMWRYHKLGVIWNHLSWIKLIHILTWMIHMWLTLHHIIGLWQILSFKILLVILPIK